MLGDLNAIRSPSETMGGANSWPNYMDDLDTCIHIAELDDLRFSGCFLHGQINKILTTLCPLKLIEYL